jgi:hypothetical protein
MTTIVCLCGSTKFERAFHEANKRETLAGKIVLTVGFFGHSTSEVITPEQKYALDALHISKINLAHEILVINPGGYIGDSTRNEIAHAIRTGKPIRSLEPLPDFYRVEAQKAKTFLDGLFLSKPRCRHIGMAVGPDGLCHLCRVHGGVMP